MATHDLSKLEVADLIYSYKEHEVTDQLYDFGKTLLDHIVHRSDRVNSQSATVLAWATAILAFLFVNASKFSGNLVYAMFASAIFSMAAVLLSFTALRTRKHWKWPSDQSWIHGTGLDNADELKRYHVRVMHDLRKSRQALTDDKASFLLLGELALIVAALILFAGIVFQLRFA